MAETKLEPCPSLCGNAALSPRMWCETCCTVTTDGKCHCEAPKLVDYADAGWAIVQELKAENARMREALDAFLAWFDKQDDGMEGVRYLNGDSDKYEGNGHDDVRKVAALARSALTDTKET